MYYGDSTTCRTTNCAVQDFLRIVARRVASKSSTCCGFVLHGFRFFFVDLGLNSTFFVLSRICSTTCCATRPQQVANPTTNQHHQTRQDVAQFVLDARCTDKSAATNRTKWNLRRLTEGPLLQERMHWIHCFTQRAVDSPPAYNSIGNSHSSGCQAGSARW